MLEARSLRICQSESGGNALALSRKKKLGKFIPTSDEDAYYA